MVYGHWQGSNQSGIFHASFFLPLPCFVQMRSKGGSGVLEHFNGSHIRALIQLYPELELKQDKFLQFRGLQSEEFETVLIFLVSLVPLGVRSGLAKPEQQRKFFDEFAKSKNFNSMDAEKWYSVTRKEIRRLVVSCPNC
jgi:hypothetical protein